MFYVDSVRDTHPCDHLNESYSTIISFGIASLSCVGDPRVKGAEMLRVVSFIGIITDVWHHFGITPVFLPMKVSINEKKLIKRPLYCVGSLD